MASGDNVVQIIDVMVPAANYATPDKIAGGSTPGELLDVWDFDASSDEHLDFKCRLNGYGSGGLTFTLFFSADGITSGNVKLDVAVRRLDTAEDIDGSHTYSYQTVTVAVPGTDGAIKSTTVTMTDGAQMDSWADGEMAIVRVRRDADDAADTAAADLELVAMFGAET